MWPVGERKKEITDGENNSELVCADSRQEVGRRIKMWCPFAA
jgi:hypothetical protein